MSDASDSAQAEELSEKTLTTLNKLWARFRLAGDDAPFTVRPALTSKEIVALEAELGGKLPAVIKASLLISAGLDWKPGSRHAEYPWLKPGSAEVVTGTELVALCGEVHLDADASARFVVVMRATARGCMTLLLGELSSGRLMRMTYVDNLADPPHAWLEEVPAGCWYNPLWAVALTTCGWR